LTWRGSQVRSVSRPPSIKSLISSLASQQATLERVLEVPD
jgi:hypothetical protein